MNRRLSDLVQPYEYHASPAVAVVAPAPVSTSPYVAPSVATAGYGAPAGRNTTPGVSRECSYDSCRASMIRVTGDAMHC